VLIPALLLGLLWDWLGMLLPVSARHYRDGFPQFAKLVPAAGFTVRAILGDLLFLQKYTGPPGSNDVVWSLFCEFWFYVFLPAVIGVLTAVRNASLRRALIPLALSALSFWILNGYWDPLAIWLLGVAIALTSRYWAFGPKRPVVASACTIATGLAFGAVLALTRLGSDLPGPLPGLAFALFLHCVIQTPPSFGAPFTRLARAFANFSYSLYMLHFPVLLLISCFFVQSAATRWRPDAPHQAAFFAICCLVLAYAYLIARVTEHRTSALRAWLQTAVLR
jgi:peptidoglycan/LPS O-acetylase OafA/YrhL